MESEAAFHTSNLPYFHPSNPLSFHPLFDEAFLYKLERLSILSRRAMAGQLQGERRSPKRGQSVEFADFRPYTPGDDFRRIDWNAYARLERFFLKLFVEEEDLTVHLLVDTSRSMDWGQPNKLWYAVRAAGALGYIGATEESWGSFFGGLADGNPDAWGYGDFDYPTLFWTHILESNASLGQAMTLATTDFYNLQDSASAMTFTRVCLLETALYGDPAASFWHEGGF